jgi:radical SAM superfamily enzyme YgiQ (UPF0313 family)
MCTYYSPIFLLPPHDLVQLATYAREVNYVNVHILDAIASSYSLPKVLRFIAELSPNMIVSLAGVETFGEDMACLDHIKETFPEITHAVFGYYPSVFPEETLRKSKMDLVLRCEPEEPLSNYLAARVRGTDVDTVPGLAGYRGDGLIFSNQEQRVTCLDGIPFPDYGLVDVEKYEEAFWGGPCGAILSARGCPFSCSYCTSTYGRRLVVKSPETVVSEMAHLKSGGIRFIRFLDDTFTCDRRRVIDICKIILDTRLQVSWSCLSRVDTLEGEMLEWMARAGCKRVLVGIESYSQKVLDYLNKRIDAHIINDQLFLIKQAGIESFGFFMVGAPVEGEEEFQETLEGMLSAPLDFITVNSMVPYAGTPFFNQVEQEIRFSLLPFCCEYKDANVPKTMRERRRHLYIRFYMRPGILMRHFYAIVAHPLRALKLLWLLTTRPG